MNRYDRQGLVLTFSSIAALLMTSTASAVTITNRGDKETKVSIIEGTAKQDLVLDVGKAIVGVCQQGCIIRLNDSESDEYELEGSESVSVDEGFLYYDDSEAGGAPDNGDAPSEKVVPK
ncbi:MAG: hypothetical protein WBP38_11425 [Hyphomicrobium sp.]|jgi:hypothetical protein|nr:hypothetical protein [Hyphomicrobium sp.]